MSKKSKALKATAKHNGKRTLSVPRGTARRLRRSGRA